MGKQLSIEQKNMIFMGVFIVLTVGLFGTGIYMAINDGNPGLQIFAFLLGGAFGITLLATVIKNRWYVYMLFILHLLVLSIYAWDKQVDLELLVSLGFFWLLVLYIPYEYMKQKRVKEYFEKQFQQDLSQHFLLLMMTEEEPSVPMEFHPYLDGTFNEGFKGNGIQAEYKDYSFSFYEYSLEGKKDNWQGGVLELTGLDLEDTVLRYQDYDLFDTYHLDPLFQAYDDIVWVVKDGNLTVYVQGFVPIFDVFQGKIKNPADHIKDLLDLVIETIDTRNK